MVINRYLNYQSIPKQVKDIITKKSYNDMVNSSCAPSQGCVVKPVGFRFIQGLANQIIASLGMMPVTAFDKRRQQESRVE